MIATVATFFTAYLTAQFILFPVVLFYLNMDYSKLSFHFLRRLRISVSLLALTLPLLLWVAHFLPTDSFEILNFEPWVEQVSPISPPLAADAKTGIAEVDNPSNDLVLKPVIIGISGMLSLYQGLHFYLTDVLVWFSVFGLFLLGWRLIFQAFQLVRLAANCQKSTIEHGVILLVGSINSAPFSLGLGRGVIFLPAGLKKQDRDIILAHELCHIKRSHTIWSAVDSLMTALFFYNPLAHMIKRQADLIMEVECDAETAEKHDNLAYCQTLLDFAHRNVTTQRQLLVVQGWGGRMILQKRIQYLLAEKKCIKNNYLKVFATLLTAWMLISVVLVTGCNVSNQQGVMTKRLQHDYLALTYTHGEASMGYLPNHLVSAFLLTKDSDFYNHQGIDFLAMFKSYLSQQGDDELLDRVTITQQVVRRFHNSEKQKTFGTKIDEINMVRELERTLSKDEILAMYMNSISFGNDIYGIKQASLHYFGCYVVGISPAESAMLALMADAPPENSYQTNRNRLRTQQERLLNQMVDAGHLSANEVADSLRLFWENV